MNLPFFCQMLQKRNLIELVAVIWGIVVVFWLIQNPGAAPLY